MKAAVRRFAALLDKNPERADRLLSALEREPTNKTTVRTALEAYDLLLPLLGGRETEAFAVIFLNGRHRAFAVEILTTGSERHCIVDPRQVYRRALQLGAMAIVVAHNHPSNDATPSPEDIAVTKQLAAAGRVVGVRLLDHLVVTDDAYTSLCERGHIAQAA